MEEVITLTGSQKGPVSVVMAGVHGNEPCGLNAFRLLLPTLEVEAGTVYFVIGNPNAIAKNVRFTEFNLNRAFKQDAALTDEERNSYEYRRAQFLKLYLDEASALLDIHSSFTPESFPFVICEENGFGIARHLPVGLVISGFDRTNPGGTDEYMNRTGKIGICIECGHHSDPKASSVAMQAILSFLRSRKHIPGTANEMRAPQRRILIEKLHHSSGELKLAMNWSDFEAIPRLAVICEDNSKEIQAEEDCIILFARNCEQAGKEAFYLGREIVELGPYGEWPKDGH